MIESTNIENNVILCNLKNRLWQNITVYVIDSSATVVVVVDDIVVVVAVVYKKLEVK